MGCALKYGHGWLTSVGGGWREKGYIIAEISQRRGGGEKWREVPGKREKLGVHILERGVFSFWDIGPSDSMFLAPIWSSSTTPKQAVAPSEPNLWTHSLQIHCNGLGLKAQTLQLASFVGRLLVRWWMQWLVKAGSNSLGEVMVASLLYHKRRTARWFTAQRASGTMCVAFAPTKWFTKPPRISWAAPLGPDWGGRRPREALQGGSATGLVLEDRHWCLLTH